MGMRFSLQCAWVPEYSRAAAAASSPPSRVHTESPTPEGRQDSSDRCGFAGHASDGAMDAFVSFGVGGAIFHSRRAFRVVDRIAGPGCAVFFGTATYHTTLHISGAAILAKAPNVAEPGRRARDCVRPHQWRFRADTVESAIRRARIDRQLHAGDNAVEVEVTNLWPNRIIGDLQPSATKTYTKTNVRAYTKDSPLLPSGLLEPITLEVGSVQRIR